MTTSPSTRPRPVGIARLTQVELRKTINTRAGLGLAIGSGLLMVLVAIAVNFTGSSDQHTFADTLRTTVFNASIIIPIVSLLLFTGEWGTRSAMTTFALTPRRGRVIAAKFLASATVGLAGFVIAAVLAVFTVAVGSPGDGAWDISGTLLAQTAVWCALSSVGGAALGSLILNSAGAIVALFALPIGLGLLAIWERIREGVEWLDQGTSLALLAERTLHGDDWQHVAVGIAFWAVLPLVLGATRIVRQDIA